MSSIVEKTLISAMQNDNSVVIVYMGKQGISQRRIYVKSVKENKVTAYCFKSKGIRVFDRDNILSAQIIE